MYVSEMELLSGLDSMTELENLITKIKDKNRLDPDIFQQHQKKQNHKDRVAIYIYIPQLVDKLQATK